MPCWAHEKKKVSDTLLKPFFITIHKAFQSLYSTSTITHSAFCRICILFTFCFLLFTWFWAFRKRPFQLFLPFFAALNFASSDSCCGRSKKRVFPAGTNAIQIHHSTRQHPSYQFSTIQYHLSQSVRRVTSALIRYHRHAHLFQTPCMASVLSLLSFIKCILYKIYFLSLSFQNHTYWVVNHYYSHKMLICFKPCKLCSFACQMCSFVSPLWSYACRYPSVPRRLSLVLLPLL